MQASDNKMKCNYVGRAWRTKVESCFGKMSGTVTLLDFLLWQAYLVVVSHQKCTSSPTKAQLTALEWMQMKAAFNQIVFYLFHIYTRLKFILYLVKRWFLHQSPLVLQSHKVIVAEAVFPWLWAHTLCGWCPLKPIRFHFREKRSKLMRLVFIRTIRIHSASHWGPPFILSH